MLSENTRDTGGRPMSQPDASPDAPYPPEVLRYGERGKAAFDAAVAALVGVNVPPHQARQDILANWHLICLQFELLPPRSA
jgi:hypothetical protein